MASFVYMRCSHVFEGIKYSNSSLRALLKLLLGSKFWSRVSYIFMKLAFWSGQLLSLVSAGLLRHGVSDIPEYGFSIWYQFIELSVASYYDCLS